MYICMYNTRNLQNAHRRAGRLFQQPTIAKIASKYFASMVALPPFACGWNGIGHTIHIYNATGTTTPTQPIHVAIQPNPIPFIAISHLPIAYTIFVFVLTINLLQCQMISLLAYCYCCALPDWSVDCLRWSVLLWIEAIAIGRVRVHWPVKLLLSHQRSGNWQGKRASSAGVSAHLPPSPPFVMKGSPQSPPVWAHVLVPVLWRLVFLETRLLGLFSFAVGCDNKKRMLWMQ